MRLVPRLRTDPAVSRIGRILVRDQTNAHGCESGFSRRTKVESHKPVILEYARVTSSQVLMKPSVMIQPPKSGIGENQQTRTRRAKPFTLDYRCLVVRWSSPIFA